MATVNKDFRIKSGLIVEGVNATINGEDIITTGSSTDNLSEGSSNLYFTNQRAIDAVGGSATDANTPNTVVKRDGNGAFAAGTISANQVNVQNAGSIYEDGALVIDSAAGYGVGIYGHNEVYVRSNGGDIVLNADGKVYNGLASSANEVATKGTLDSLIGDSTVDGSTGNTVKARIDSAVAGLVDSAPALLDTLNELAAAIADNPNYATDMATSLSGKQDVLSAGTGIDITSNTVSVDTTIATKTYVDNAISSGVGAITTDSVPEGSTNLYLTNTRVIDGVYGANIAPATVTIDSYRKEEATRISIGSGTTANLHTFTYPYESVKYLVRVVGWVGGVKHSQLTEILITTDGNNNIAITEYGTIYTSENPIASFTATTLGGDFTLTATVGTVNSCEIITAATMLSWAD